MNHREKSFEYTCIVAFWSVLHFLSQFRFVFFNLNLGLLTMLITIFQCSWKCDCENLVEPFDPWKHVIAFLKRDLTAFSDPSFPFVSSFLFCCKPISVCAMLLEVGTLEAGTERCSKSMCYLIHHKIMTQISAFAQAEKWLLNHSSQN